MKNMIAPMRIVSRSNWMHNKDNKYGEEMLEGEARTDDAGATR
jgi:hypothetical protein